MKLNKPFNIVETDQLGFHELGWKSLIVKQSLVSGWNLPEGVVIRMVGGLKGYSAGKVILP